jgi:hypothetical protein
LMGVTSDLILHLPSNTQTCLQEHMQADIHGSEKGGLTSKGYC